MVRDILQCNPDTETTTKVKNIKTHVQGIVLLSWGSFESVFLCI